MSVRHLKKIRLIISLIFFISLSAVFLDFRNNIPPHIQGYILYLQFVPLILKATLGAISVSILGLLIILMLTLLFGRIYCSSICPLGTLQDIINYFSRKFRKKKKKRFNFNKEHRILRYSILVLTILAFVSGTVFLLNLVDPYSNFGKVTTNLFRPVLIKGNNFISSLLEIIDLYWLYPYEVRYTGLLTWGYPILFLSLVGYLAFTSGRLYCNSICPVGTLLGFLSKYTLFKIKIDKDKCKSCGICEKVCKANCIDSKSSKNIDVTRCVNCYNCLDVCPTDGIKFRIKHTTNGVVVNESKRKFVAGIIFYLAGTTVVSYAQNKIIPKKKSKIPNLKKYPVSPPGSESIARFTDLCTACHLCIGACPTQVLQPSFLEYGFVNMLQPRMDYQTSFCNFECNLCSQICPTGAIKLLQLPEKKIKQLGKVTFIEKNCIVHTENTECGACSEHCPTKAVSMVPYNKLFSPKVNDEICIGCGACEYACPVKPYKAIYVEGNPVHLTAKKPEIKKLKEKVDYKEDFPF